MQYSLYEKDGTLAVDVELLLKVAGLAMIVAVVCQVLSRIGRDDHATMVSVTGIVLILMLLAEKVGELLNLIKGVFGF